MMKKNRNLLVLLGVQLIIIATLYFSGKDSGRLDFDNKLFTVSDTSRISKVQLINEVNSVTLENVNGTWFIDGKEKADPSLIVYIKSVLNRVEITRPVSSKQRVITSDQLKSDGILVKVFDGQEVIKEFYAGGNRSKTKSYFAQNDKPYIVNVRGYQDYLSGIFKLKAHQWKDRLVFNSSWRSVSKIAVERKTDDGFTISFTGKDLTVEGIVPLDTNNMMNYISQYRGFMINEFVVTGQFDRYDSLAQTQPLATLAIEDIDQSKNLKVNVFPALPREEYHLLTDENGRMMMVDRQRVANLIPPRKAFVKREKPNF